MKTPQIIVRPSEKDYYIFNTHQFNFTGLNEENMYITFKEDVLAYKGDFIPTIYITKEWFDKMPADIIRRCNMKTDMVSTPNKFTNPESYSAWFKENHSDLWVDAEVRYQVAEEYKKLADHLASYQCRGDVFGNEDNELNTYISEERKAARRAKRGQ